MTALLRCQTTKGEGTAQLGKGMFPVKHVSIGFYFLRKVMIVAYTTIYHCVIIPGAPPLVTVQWTVTPCKGRSSLWNPP